MNELFKSVLTIFVILVLVVAGIAQVDNMFYPKTPFTDLYRAERLRLDNELASVAANMPYLSRVDASGGKDLLVLAELRRCVALAKLGRELSAAQQVQLLTDGETSREYYEYHTTEELKRALELRKLLLERGISIPEEDSTFLSHQESLLRK